MARKRNYSKQTQGLLAVLLEQPREWRYGYDLSKATGLKSGTLYPILMRLDEQGLVESGWRESDQPGRPPRHIYRLSRKGLRFAEQQSSEIGQEILNKPLGSRA